MCDDPNAINYEDMYDFCEYRSTVNFYVSESTLELMQEYSPSGSANTNHYIRLYSSQSSYYQSSMYFTNSLDFDDYYCAERTDCHYYYFNNMYFSKEFTNPAGAIDHLYVTLEYYNEDPIVLWEGDVHFAPSDQCKILEVTYE